MAPRLAERRIAIVGAESPPGIFLKSTLEESRVPGRQVDLFGATRGETVLSEYAGEARIIQDPDLDDVSDHDVVYVCERGPAAETILESLGSTNLLVDMTGSERARSRGRLAHVDMLPPTGSGEAGTGVYTIPHFLSIAIADLLGPLQDGPGLNEVVVVALHPAADLGDAGVEELRRQTVNLLNFTGLPVETFGRQLAFNLIPESLFPLETAGLSARLAGEVGGLLGWSEPRLTASLVMVPVFFGHCLQVRVAPARGVTASVAEEWLRQVPGLEIGGSGNAATPVESGGSGRFLVSDITEDGLGGVWFWAVLEDAGLAAARQAVRLADMLCDREA